MKNVPSNRIDEMVQSNKGQLFYIKQEDQEL